MDRIETVYLADRCEDGNHHKHRGVGVNEHAHDKKDDNDGEDSAVFAVEVIGHEGRDDLGEVHPRHDVGEHAGHRDHAHAHCGSSGSGDRAALELFIIKLTRDYTVEETVYDGEHTGFGRGAYAAENGAYNDDGHDERADRLLEHGPDITPSHELAPRHFLYTRIDIGVYHIKHAAHDAGDDAADQYAADGRAGRRGEDDHRDARRNDNACGERAFTQRFDNGYMPAQYASAFIR